MPGAGFVTCLWFGTRGEEAASFYVSVFRDSRGWVTDRYGVSWQVVPRVLTEMISDPGQEKAARATAAMLKMVKLDVAALQRAYAGE